MIGRVEIVLHCLLTLSIKQLIRYRSKPALRELDFCATGRRLSRFIKKMPDLDYVFKKVVFCVISREALQRKSYIIRNKKQIQNRGTYQSKIGSITRRCSGKEPLVLPREGRPDTRARPKSSLIQNRDWFFYANLTGLQLRIQLVYNKSSNQK